MLLTSCIVCMASSPQKKKFDRGFGSASSLFVPKGTMTAGASLSYHRYDAGNGDIGYEFMSLITGVEGTLSTVSISPAVLYFIGNNTAIGARFGYAYTSMDVNGASISLDSDNGFDLSNRFIENQSYSGSVVLRNYLPLSAVKSSPCSTKSASAAPSVRANPTSWKTKKKTAHSQTLTP